MSTKSILIGIVLFGFLTLAVLGTLYYYQQQKILKTTTSQAIEEKVTLLNNCQLFYNFCIKDKPVIRYDFYALQQLIEHYQSPLVAYYDPIPQEIINNNKNLPYDAWPASALTDSLAAKYNVNPIIILTLFELKTHLITNPNTNVITAISPTTTVYEYIDGLAQIVKLQIDKNQLIYPSESPDASTPADQILTTVLNQYNLSIVDFINTFNTLNNITYNLFQARYNQKP